MTYEKAMALEKRILEQNEYIAEGGQLCAFMVLERYVERC